MLNRLGILILGAALLPSPVSAEASAQGAENRLIIAFKDGVTTLDRQEILEAEGLQMLDEIPEMKVVLVEAPAGRTQALETRLMSNPRIRLAGPDIRRNWLLESPVSFQQAPMPSVDSVVARLPRFNPAPAVSEVPWGVAKVNAPAAWGSSQGAGVTVAVVDTGVDPRHPDLKDKLVGGYNALQKGASWADDHFHGTHVAGTIAAALDGQRVAGVAPKASLLAVKVLNKEGGGTLFSIMDGINWSAKNGASVINMSLGAPQEIPFLQMALQQAKAAGVTIVAAAGNDGKAVNYPAAYPEAIAVSALCPQGVKETRLCPSTAEGISTFSSRGPQIAFIAPGVLIPSTVPFDKDDKDGIKDGVASFSGTSMACPHVAGLAALAVAAGASSPEAVRDALTAAASPMPGLSPSEQGAGLVDAARLSK